jgi:hypothetical protein
MVLIKVLTFNVDSDGNIKDNIKDIQLEFEKFVISKLTEDAIFLISFQEDEENPLLLREEFKKILISKQYIIHIESKGIKHFYVHNIIISKKKYTNLNIISQSINPSGSKNYIIQNIKVDDILVSFTSAHLPINTKDIKNLDLGFEERKKVLDDILDKYINDDNIMIFAGDLNFRINQQGDEQLTKYIKEYVKKKSEFNFTDIFDITKFGPTCKINPDFKQSDMCKTQFIKKKFSSQKINCIKDNSGEICKCNEFDKSVCPIHIKCYDEKNKRIPSYCDRILVIQKNKKYFVVPKLEKTEIVSTIDKFSDHNAVYVEFELNLSTQLEQKGGYYFKYLKYKQKYIELRKNS